jgi:hypothetical protein
MTHAPAADAIDRRLDALACQRFRVKFRLVGIPAGPELTAEER